MSRTKRKYNYIFPNFYDEMDDFYFYHVGAFRYRHPYKQFIHSYKVSKKEFRKQNIYKLIDVQLQIKTMSL